jgi:hypothetical protein
MDKVFGKIDDSDINKVDVTGCPPLGWAVLLGNHTLVKELLDRGANPNVRIFPYLYQMFKLDWILEPALNIITKLLPQKFRDIIQKENILKIFKVLKEYGYMNSDGIQIKYIANILYEVNKFPCFTSSMLKKWKTQEDFNRRLFLTFWFFPIMADENNKKIHEFYSSSKINQRIRYEIVKTFNDNPQNSYKIITEYLPLNKNAVDPFLNQEWEKTIIPNLVHKLMVRVICLTEDLTSM